MSASEKKSEGRGTKTVRHPGIVVLKEVSPGLWKLLGETDVQPGLTAKKARNKAVMDLTNGDAKSTDNYAAIVRSEWKLSLEWK